LANGRIGLPGFTKPTHRRQAGEAITKTLHAAAFVVDGNQHVGPRRTNGCGECAQLRGLGVVAAKQDDAADQRVLQDLALFSGDFIGSHVEHDRTGLGVGWLHGFSMTAKATT
jgi:hypothetical protein